MATIDLPDLPSWLWLLVIGVVIVLLLNPIGWAIVGIALVIGLIYFIIDIWSKVG